MPPSAKLLGFLVLTSFVAWCTIARVHLLQLLDSRTKREALMLMILPQMFRHVGAMAMFPGIGDTPGEWSEPLAWGDAITAWLAIVSTISLHLRFSHATKIVWAFNIWGTLDLLHNGYNAARLQIAPRLGVIGYVVAFCVPMMLVFHLLIFRSLIRHPYPDR